MPVIASNATHILFLYYIFHLIINYTTGNRQMIIIFIIIA